VSRRPDPSTEAARAGLGQARSPSGEDLVPGLTLASVRAYADLASVDAGMETRDVYRRHGGGTPALLESALAALETPDGGAAPLARVTSSGQAALLLATLLLVTRSRPRVVVLRPAYGGTESLLAGPLGNAGVQLTTVDLPPAGEADTAAIVGGALGPDVAAVVTEVITNPLMTLVDLPAVAAVAHDAGAAYVVDATFATPLLLRPFEHGADLVFHSLTKHLAGHSDMLGGVVLVDPAHPAADWLDSFARLAGCNLSPFDAWLALRGLRTAGLRLERSSANAAALAAWFTSRPEVAAVHYPGRHGAREEELAARLLPRGRGPMLGVELQGGRPAVDAFVRALRGVRLAPSLGDVATTVSHPALTSHRALSAQQRKALGVSDGLLRVSVGVEALDDLCDELAAALAAASATA
jgi:cystathionine beta-lyase/cystathionine gamma-synthase